jgi:regulator of PEP synthase PpsR (kinase-PPPase family)
MFSIYAVSDATGKTAEGVVRAALTQFDSSDVSITRFGGVRTPARIREIIDQAARSGGFVVHTLVSASLRRVAFTEGRARNVATIDLMGPMLTRVSELLDTQPRSEPGLYQTFDQAYLLRIDAIDFTVRHDDGRNVHELDKADVVIVGVSRTSKTPLSIYMGYRGWKVANVPIILGINPPDQLFQLPRRRVIGLVVKPERLVDLRRARAKSMGVPYKDYADLDHIRREVAYAYQVFERRRDWPLVDVTAKPIEETAAEVVALIGGSDDRLMTTHA